MNINISLKPRSLLNLFLGAVGLATLLFGAFYLTTLFTSRSTQTSSQPQQPIVQEQTSSTIIPTPTTSQTDLKTGWRVYSDSTYGYSINYPPDWVAKDVTRREKERDPLRIVLFRPDVPSTFFSDINEEIDPDFASIAAVTVRAGTVEEVVTRAKLYGLSHAREQAIVINKISGVKLEGETIAWDYRKQQSTTEQSIVVILPLGQNTITFSFAPKPLIYTGDYSDVFEKMLASLSIK